MKSEWTGLFMRIFLNSNHSVNFLDFSYFVITQLLKRNSVKLVHRAPNGGILKFAPPNACFVEILTKHVREGPSNGQ